MTASGRETLSIRTARKTHACDGYLVFRIWGQSTPCEGTIQAGERYYDDRREGWEILRYHVRCGEYGDLPNEEPTTRGETR